MTDKCDKICGNCFNPYSSIIYVYCPNCYPQGAIGYPLQKSLSSEFEDYIAPSFDETFMKMVYIMAEKSKDPRTKIAAVLTRDKHIISTGYNGFPMGVNDKKERYEDRETKYKFVAHAEDNSILSAARFGISTMGSTLYTNGYPCESCMKSIIQGGIKEIVIHKQWPDMPSEKWKESIKISKIMLEESGIKIRVLDKILGMKGYLDGKILSV